MPTLGSLMDKFASAAGENSTAPYTSPSAAPESGEIKTASGGGNNMTSLADIFMHLSDMDKTAAAAADAPPQDHVDFAKVAEDLAEAEASTVVEEDQDMIKVAAEYDAAGRIIARGFFDEFMKLAAGVTTTEASNQNTESETAAKTPALGERGLPTVETNYAGSPNHDQPIDTKSGRDAYKDSLAPSKKIDAGVTGDDPEAAALSIGAGSPAGFATVRDLMG